jgi:hypothetical protein
MSSAAWFIIVFVGFAALRLAIATAFFYAVLDDDGHCPVCDAETIRIRARGWNLLMPWFRTSYCMECGWEGLLRHVGAGATRESVGRPRRPAFGARKPTMNRS